MAVPGAQQQRTKFSGLVGARGNPDSLLLAVRVVGVVGFGKTSGVPQFNPVGSAVTGAGEASRIYEGLCQDERMSMNELPILAQSCQIETKNAGGQILDALTRQNQKAAVIRDQCQALPLPRGRSANPVIPACHFECR